MSEELRKKLQLLMILTLVDIGLFGLVLVMILSGVRL